MKRPYFLDEGDAQQIKAILMTHAEMQDRTTLQSEEVISSLQQFEHDDDTADMIDDLKDSIELCQDDCDNLKRIADLF